MITTTLGALVALQPALGRLMAIALPVKVAYSLSKIAARVSEDVSIFHERRNALVKEFGVERDATAEELAQGQRSPICEVAVSQRPAYFARVEELMAVAVSIEWPPVLLDDLGPIMMSAADVLALAPLLVPLAEAPSAVKTRPKLVRATKGR